MRRAESARRACEKQRRHTGRGAQGRRGGDGKPVRAPETREGVPSSCAACVLWPGACAANKLPPRGDTPMARHRGGAAGRICNLRCKSCMQSCDVCAAAASGVADRGQLGRAGSSVDLCVEKYGCIFLHFASGGIMAHRWQRFGCVRAARRGMPCCAFFCPCGALDGALGGVDHPLPFVALRAATGQNKTGCTPTGF